MDHRLSILILGFPWFAWYAGFFALRWQVVVQGAWLFLGHVVT